MNEFPEIDCSLSEEIEWIIKSKSILFDEMWNIFNFSNEIQ